MPMNWMHRRICKSDKWACGMAQYGLPWALTDVELGENVLEIGPGFGVTTAILIKQAERVTALEVDGTSVDYLNDRFGSTVDIRHGDGAEMPLPDKEFSSAVCFTMLHHVPSPQLQDRLFAEARRVIVPGGVFAGMDSLPSLRFRLIHIGDTMVTVDPATLPDRLRAAGFTDIEVTVGEGRFRFHAVVPQ
jgi:SAM-dependent methyltransferase